MKAIKYAVLGLVGVIGMLVSMFGPIKVPFAESLAKTYYRYALGALLIMLMLIPAVIGLFLLTFDANNFKSEIIHFVKERTRRDLVLQGDIKITFFPKLGLDSGKLSLSQRNSAKEFASINNARFYIAWWPLFKRQLVFDRVEINGIHANVVRLMDGTTNFDDLLISDEHLAPLTFDIDSVSISDSSINWQDELEAQRLSLHDLRLETGHLADRAPSNLTASFHLDSEKAHVISTVQLKSRLFFDRTAGRYEFADLEGKLEGEAGQISNLIVDFRGSLNSYPTQGTLTAEDLVVSATGMFSQRSVTARLGVPSLKVSNGGFSGNQLMLDVNLSQPDETSKLLIQLPAFESANRIFNSAELSADFDYKGGGRTLHGKLASPLIVNFESAPSFQLDSIALTLAGSHPALSGEVAANAKGSLLVDYAGQNAKFFLEAKVDESKVKGTVAIKDFSRPAYAVELSANHLDLDRFLASEWLRRLKDDATSFSTAGLKNMSLHAHVSAGEVKLDKFKVNKLAADISIEQSMITISPVTALLYGGTLKGGFSITAHETPMISARQLLKGVHMGVLLADTAGADRLTGKSSISLDLSTQGNSVGMLRKALNGNVTLSLAHGALAGINLRSVLIAGMSDLATKGAERSYPVNFSEKTAFSELRAMMHFKDGKVSATDFVMKSPLILTAGEGEYDPDSGTINFLFNAKVSSSINRRTAGELIGLKGVTIPIRVSGPSAAPAIAVDFAAASGGDVTRLKAASAGPAATTAAVQPHRENVPRTIPAKTKPALVKPIK